MKRKLNDLTIAFFAAALCVVALSKQSAAIAAVTLTQAPTENVEQTIRRIESERSQASSRGDLATLERIYADDFSNVGTSGAIRNKAQLLADFKSGALKIASQTITDMTVRVYGDASIVTGLNTQKGTDKGQDISGQFRFTRVYVKRKGQWQLVAAHNSRATQQ